MDRKVERPLTAQEMARVMARVEGSPIDVLPFDTLMDVTRMLVESGGEDWNGFDADHQLAPWDYALPQEQTHEIVVAVMDRLPESVRVSWNLLWMNSGPSSYDEKGE